MPGVEAKIIVPDQFRAWEAGFTSLPDDLEQVVELHWRIATDLFYDRTQQAVHVISGDLKTSGRSDVYSQGQTVVGDVIYGGVQGTEGPVDYALEEEERGGDHAFMSRGWDGAQRVFDEALPLAWREVVGSWR